MEEERKIVYLFDPNGGIWTSKAPYRVSDMASFPTPQTTTGKEGIYYEKGKWLITLRTNVNKGTVIEVGKIVKIKYRILKHIGYSKTGTPSYLISKIDGTPFNPVDVGNAKHKAIVNILGRHHFRQKLKEFNEL